MNFLHEIATWHVLLSRKYDISRSAQRQGRFLVVIFVVDFFQTRINPLLCHFPLPTTGRNEPLKKDRPKWKSDYPMTEGQLRSKRDEFWDTAPAFEGRKEIWDALKAAAVALECNDHELAQAIVDGASITLPHGEDAKTK